MDRNKLDPGPTLAEVLAAADLPLYGQDYQSPALGGDEIYGTSDVSRIMSAQRAAKEREPYEALTRLATTLVPGAAAAHRATAGPLARSGCKQAHEGGVDNPLVNGATDPFLRAYLMAAAPMARRKMIASDEDPQFLSRFIMQKPALHAEDTGMILEYLLERGLGSPKKTLY